MLRKQVRIVGIFERRLYNNGSPGIIYNPRRYQGTEFIHVLDSTNRYTATFNGILYLSILDLFPPFLFIYDIYFI